MNIGAYTKGRNQFYDNKFRSLYAADEGRNYGPKLIQQIQQDQLDNPTKTYNFRGEQVEIGKLDISKSDVLNDLLTGQIQPYLKERGLEQFSGIMLDGFYKNSADSITQSVGTIRNAEIQEQKLDRQDKAKSIFRLDPTPINAKLLQTTLTQSGLSEKQARDGLVSQLQGISDQEFEAIGDMPSGPNGLSFREQYPVEWQQAITQRNAFTQSKRNATKFSLESADEEATLEFLQLRQKDIEEDGTFDADPEVLSQAATEAELAGRPKHAKALRAAIPLTQSKQYDSQFLKQLKEDQGLGINNYSIKQIMENPSLSDGAKRDAITAIKSFNETAVPKEVSTEAKGIINTALKDRAKVNEFGGNPTNLSVKIMQSKAWREYSSVYAREYQRTGSKEQAAEAAINDFYNKFGDDPTKGLYAITEVLDNPQAAGTYVNGSTPAGKAYAPSTSAIEAAIKFETKGANVALAEPELYTGETKQLTQMLEGAASGKISVPALYDIQQKSGGNMSMRQLLNKRLKANGLDEIPQDVGKLADEVEQSFDPRYSKFLNYKPNTTRTDIAAIASGQDPIYTPRIPANVADDEEFRFAVTDVAQRLGINEGDLYAVMDFETGGSFSPAQRNAAGSGATGLIQFMPSTAEGLGTSTEALSKMSRAQQMSYVYQYLKNAGVKSGMGMSDLYMSVLFPAAVGKPDDFVLFGRGAMSGYTGRAYSQNAGLDRNGDGSITKAEASAKVLGTQNAWRQARNMRPELVGGR